MTSIDLVRSQLRNLTTTRMPVAFGAVVVLLAAVNGVAVVVGTDMDGSKTFISTGADQQSLVAFAANALMLAALFGATAAAREYAHNTVIATYLITPRRPRALRAQLTAIGAAGAVIGLAGTAFTVVAVAVTLPFTDYAFLMSATDVLRVLGVAAWSGAAGAVLGAAIGTLVRNTGGAVSVTVVALVIAPPVVVQLVNEAARWIPMTLAMVASGNPGETGPLTSLVAIAAWALLPAAAALVAVQRRDVV
jgi:ABC-2 type transport system permease protein